MEVTAVLEWKLQSAGGIAIPVFCGKAGVQPHLPVQDVMRLVYESTNDKENVKRFRSQWLQDIQLIHQKMWQGFPVPGVFKSCRDPTRNEDALTHKSAMPLSLLMSLMVAAAQRKRIDWSIRPATFLIEIINSVCDLGTETLIWKRIGDNCLVTIHLTGRKVDPSLLWTQTALESWIHRLFSQIDGTGKPWCDTFSFEDPDLASVIMLCLDPVVAAKQPMVTLLAYSAVAFVTNSIARNTNLLFRSFAKNSSNTKFIKFKRQSAENLLAVQFGLQQTVRRGDVT